MVFTFQSYTNLENYSMKKVFNLGGVVEVGTSNWNYMGQLAT